MAKSENINAAVSGLEHKVGTHEAQIASMQAIMTFGFIIALITLGAVIVSAVAFAVGEVNKSNEHTRILQQINDKLDNSQKAQQSTFVPQTSTEQAQ